MKEKPYEFGRLKIPLAGLCVERLFGRRYMGRDLRRLGWMVVAVSAGGST